MRRVQTAAFYGLRTDIIGNAYFLADDQVVYVVGNVLAVHDFSQERQRLNRLSEKHRINLMVISPNKKIAALCETSEKPLISIYDMQSLKRKRSFGLPADSIGVTSFTGLSFTCDSKLLAAVTNAETQTMLIYNFEKGKVVTSLEVGNPQISNSNVNLICCNPSDTGVIALGGTYVFKFLTMSERVWRPYGFSKADNFVLTSMAWLNSDRLLAGTINGKILFLENGDLKYVFNVAEITVMNLKIKEEYAMQRTNSQANLFETRKFNLEIRSIVSFYKGFAYGIGYGEVVIFEKQEQLKYVKRTVFTIPSKILNDNEFRLFRINTISANPSADTLVITTGWSQLYYVKIWEGVEYTSESEVQYANVLGNDLHHGPIRGVSVCSWKSYVLTFGERDRSIRIWDFETKNLIMMKQYLQDITCAILHPSGFLCLIGFSDKLRLMSIQIDDFTLIAEFPIRKCKIAAFSFGGHFFAAVNGNIIQVYSSIDFSIRFLLKGHVEIIQGITWSQDDTKLISIGLEGAIYYWNMSDGERFTEIVLKGITLYGFKLSADGLVGYCISSDNKIHEIKDGAVIRSFSIPGIEPRCLVTGKNDNVIFVAYPGGFVASLKYPLQETIEYYEYQFHCSDINQMALSFDDQMLITSGEDGTICFWKVVYPEGKIVAVHGTFTYLDQILISREELEKKVQNIKDLNTRLKELEREHEYKMRQDSIEHNEKILEIHQSYCEAIEELRDRIVSLEQDHTNEINNMNVEIDKTSISHNAEMRKMEISYNAKLIFEYDKYDNLRKECNDVSQEYEDKIDRLVKSSKAELEETITKYESRMQEKELQLQESHEEMFQKVQVHEIIKTQIEEDMDREIVDLRTSYETKLYEERQLILKYKGEAGMLRNKQKNCEKEVEDVKWQLGSLRDEYNQQTSRKEELEKTLANLREELVEKSTAVLDKEKDIKKLERSNAELEKYRFVLNERIQELMAEIDPRDKRIAELKEKVADMETELVGLNKTREDLDLKQYELKGKIRALGKELEREELRRKRYQRLLRKIRVDLVEAVGLIKDPTALKNCVIRLYRRYSDVEQFLRSHRADMDTQCEFMKQRGHFERTIAILKKQLSMGKPDLEAQFNKLLDDNVMLLEELHTLKKELKCSREQIADVEVILEPSGSQNKESRKPGSPPAPKPSSPDKDID